MKLQKQRGAALIIFAVIFALAATAFLVSSLDGTSIRIERDKITAATLAEAKVALIGFATNFRRPGALPCPDTNNDGSSDTNGNIGCYSNIGRLPWKSLALDDLRDGNGDRLWYSVSPNFRNVPSTTILNSDNTLGTLNVCPNAGCGDPSPIPVAPTNAPLPILVQQAAVIFSPGSPLVGQNRSDGVDINPAPAINVDNAKKAINYLDSVTLGVNQFNNAAGSNNGNDFTLGVKSSTYNDRLLTINTAEILNNIDKRMQAKKTLSGIASCLIEYANRNAVANDKRLPWPAPLTMSDYSDAINFDDDASRYAGRMPYHISSSTTTLPAHDWSTNGPTTRNRMESCSNWPEWWNSWKNHVFYAVSKDFAANTTAPQSCLGNCVSVDGVGPFAAVLIFSGKRLAGQNRVTNADMGNPNNFLEDKNSTEVSGNSGNGDFTLIINSVQNDTTICIRQNLTIDLACSTP
jgi:hypothetical protein